MFKFKKKILLFFVGLWLLIFLGLIFYSLFFSKQALRETENFNFKAASQAANRAVFLPKILSQITGHKIPDIEIWQNTLRIISQLEKLQIQGSEFFAASLDPESKPDVLVQQLNNTLTSLNYLITQLLSRKAGPALGWNYLPTPLLFKTQAKKVEKLSALTHLIQANLNDQYRYLLIFQNSDELRATGGFMGSFAILQLNSGQITELNFYDIYDAQGQIKSQVEAPAGVKEYLSGGQGQSLPDANWQADFPSSSQKILKFMQEAGFRDIGGVVAVNSTVTEDLLDLVGGIYLPDYGMTVTNENFATIARADRATFFPGKKAKKQFLETLFNHLKIKLSQLNNHQQKQLLAILKHWLETKDLQFYANSQTIQKDFQELAIAGELSSSQSEQLIYLVESNVGINKANRQISRDVKINIENKSINLELNIFNNNQDTDYINYQRLISNPEAIIQSIKVDGQQLAAWDEEIITNSQGEKFKQIGWLLPVAANQSANVQIQILGENFQALNILKQSGLPATPYIISRGQQTQSLILEKDTRVSF